jgi:micrococcal nuclease
LRQFIKALSIILIAAHSAASIAKEEMDLESLKLVEASVFYCNDGDTCRLKIADGMWLNVRLAGIDAPEVGHGKKKPGQPYGNEAKDFLNLQVQGKKVMIRQTDLDHYNRPVVELIVGNEVINRKLVQSGMAEAYRGKTKRLDSAPYLMDEAAAKKAGLGIWSQTSYMSPSDFRKNTKSK